MWVNKRIYVHKVSHNFHLVEPSPWPMLVSIFIYLNLLFTQCGCEVRDPFMIWGLVIALIAVVFAWMVDVFSEKTNGFHSLNVQIGFSMGIMLFMMSEVMLFLSFFWAFFHNSLNPSVDVGLFWPMEGFPYVGWYQLPLINTVLLLSSGVDVTLAHEGMMCSDSEQTKSLFARMYCFSKNLRYILSLRWMKNLWNNSGSSEIFFTQNVLVDGSIKMVMNILTTRFLYNTMFRGFIFLFCQFVEYFFLSYGITDGPYGSVFCMATGLHGLHVFMGLSALYYCGFMRSGVNKNGLRYWKHIVGLEGSMWYWHFVDVVWLFLFLAMYWWSSV